MQFFEIVQNEIFRDAKNGKIDVSRPHCGDVHCGQSGRRWGDLQE